MTGILNSLTFEFPVSIDDLIDTELVFILNEGLFEREPGGVIFIPFKFRPLPATSGAV